MKITENATLFGSGKESFEKSLDDFLGGLTRKKVHGSTLTFGHYEGEKDGAFIVSVFPAGDYVGYKELIFNKSDYPDELLVELSTRKICLIESGKVIFLSQNVEFSEFGILGNFFLAPTREAVIAIAKAATSKSITIISRVNDGHEKVFAFRSASYQHIDQRLIFSLVDEIEDACETNVTWKSFCIENCITTVTLELSGVDFKDEYPLPETYIPYLIIQTSDTGDCSFRVREGWKKGNSLFSGNAVQHSHRGEFDEVAFAQVVRQNIFDKLCEFPKRLCEAAEIFLSPMTLESGSDFNNNKRVWTQTIRCLSRWCGLTKAIGKKAEKSIVDEIIGSFDESQFVTLYDAINEFLVLPQTVLGLSKSAEKLLAESVMRAAYYRPKKDAIIKVA